ncbi:MAG: Fic family protein [Armatimonadetes bacterium]|jgi:fido (protein-threonine AMPylation protein)|nr:Fic family protein [Armatimonadota bacterium]
MIAYEWRPIEDIPESWRELASPGLESLASVWLEQSDKLKGSAGYGVFIERLCREWAIETGILERLYTIDRGITVSLIEKGIEAALMPHGTTDKPAEEIVAMIRDHQDALEGLFEFVRRSRELTTSYIKELHAALTQHQHTVTVINSLGIKTETAALKGEYKQLPNSPSRLEDGSIHEYCPPIHVELEMERLIEFHARHESLGVPPEIEAAWLHHRFTQIHPFQDGNGRVARALASLIFIRAGWFPLVVVGVGNERDTYIRALEAADAGDLSPLVELFATIQRREISKALSASDGIATGQEHANVIIEAAIARIRQRRNAAQEERQQRAFAAAQSLQDTAYEILSENAKDLSSALNDIDEQFWAVADRSTSKNNYWFKRQIALVAGELNYFADISTYGVWVRLRIMEDRMTEIVFSFHSLGVEPTGVVAVSAFVDHKDKTDEGKLDVDGPHRVCSEVFQIAYNEAEVALRERFDKWLNDTLTIGLEQWRRQL